MQGFCHDDTQSKVENESGSSFLTLPIGHRPLSSSFLGLPHRILNINHNKELLRGLWVGYPCG